MSEIIKTRVFYEKKDRAKYISHLDINRLMQRVLKRSGLPVWYTEGFNPHMYLTFALPLSLGYESEYECMDLRLTEKMDFEAVKNILVRNMPAGISVTKVAEPIHKAAEVGFADYKIAVFSEKLSTDILAEHFCTFFNQDEIIVTKRTKRGEKNLDIKPDIILLDQDKKEDSLIYSMRFPAGNEKNYNPSLLFDAFTEESGIALDCRVLRTNVFCKDGSLFE